MSGVRAFFVPGMPIAGEDRRERAWRTAITTAAADAAAEAAALSNRGVSLRFCLEPGRARIDLDNLVRPALDGLRDVDLFGRGFRDLDALMATKTAVTPVGLAVALMTAHELAAVRPPGRLLLTVENGALPRDGDRIAKPLRVRVR